MFASNPAGDADLDEVGTSPQLDAHGVAEAIRTVGFHRARTSVAVATSRDTRVAGGEHARPKRFPTLDRRFQGEVGEFTLTGETHGGHARQYRLTRVLGHAQRQ